MFVLMVAGSDSGALYSGEIIALFGEVGGRCGLSVRTAYPKGINTLRDSKASQGDVGCGSRTGPAHQGPVINSWSLVFGSDVSSAGLRIIRSIER